MSNPQSRFLDRKELAVTLSVSVPTIDRKTKAGGIGPKSIQISAGRVGWLRSSIESWIASAEQLGRLPNQAEWAAMTVSNGNGQRPGGDAGRVEQSGAGRRSGTNSNDSREGQEQTGCHKPVG